ncbi:MAG: RDD family protein [Brevinema sp.]
MLKKNKALKLAPWWKRLVAYGIDQLFLFTFLTIFIMGIYSKDFVELIQGIKQISEKSIITESLSTIFSSNELNQLSPEKQIQFYLIQVIQHKYSRSIFMLSQILSSLYFFLLWLGSGQTIGASLLKIRVISHSGSKPNIVSVITRVITLKIAEIAWGLPFLIVTNPIFKERIHDTASQTIVIEDFNIDELMDSSDIVKTEEQTDFHYPKDSDDQK